MGLEAVDCFYVHRRDPATPIEDVTEILASFIKAGKIKGFGFSEIAPSSLRRACIAFTLSWLCNLNIHYRSGRLN